MLGTVRIRKCRQWLGIIVAPLLLWVMIRWFEHRQIYFPTAGWHVSGDVLKRPWEDVYFTTSDGVRLNAWYLPSEEDSPRRDWVVLLCHGNAGNISHRIDLYQLLHGSGLNVFAFDYRGYGKSRGRPSEEGTYLDALAAHQWLCAKGFAPQRIVVLGESLGGAIAAELALRVPLAGLILQSTFTSIPAIGAELFPWLPVRWISTIRYDTLGKLPRINAPVCVIHSRSDSLVGFHHAEKIFSAAHDPKMLWEIEGDHNDSLLDGGTRYQEGLNRFIAMVSSQSRGP